MDTPSPEQVSATAGQGSQSAQNDYLQARLYLTEAVAHIKALSAFTRKDIPTTTAHAMFCVDNVERFLEETK